MGIFGPPNIRKLKARKNIKGLIEALKDKDEGVWRGTAMALGEIKDARAVEPLIKLLKDKNSFTREAAEEALEKIKKTKNKNN